MRSSTLATLTGALVVTALSACGGGSLTPSGAGGSAGSSVGTGEGATGGTGIVGIAGTGGGIGGGAVGGTGGLTACGGPGAPPGDKVAVAIWGADQVPVATSVSASVTVTAIAGCPQNTSADIFGAQITLSEPTSVRTWKLLLTDTAMPSDVFKVGDKLDLTVDAAYTFDQTLTSATLDQTIVLSRDGQVIFFAANLQQVGSPPLPNLLSFGIAVSDAGVTCPAPAIACGQSLHALRVSIATDASVVLDSGQTGQIGGLTITNGGSSESPSGCDARSYTVIAGFRPAATGGTAGAGGTCGTSGVGGSGGTLPACSGAGGARDSVELAIAASDGTVITSNVRAAVTVASIDSCSAVTCPTSFPGDYVPAPSNAATRIGLTGPDPQRWTLYLRNTRMPADLIKVGDTYDLTIDAHLPQHSFGGTAQTVVLAHGTDLVLFASLMRGYTIDDAPNLSAFGIGVAFGDAACETPISGTTQCGFRQHDMVAAAAGERVNVGSGASGRAGWLSFTNGGLSRSFGGFCDEGSVAAMAGYRVP